MQKGSKALADIRSSLLEMGYSQKMISLAIKDTKIATVQNVLNQILSKEAQYTSAIAKSNPYNDSMSEGSESDEEAENQDLKTMDPDSLNYVDSCIQAFSVRLRSKDPNWIILELSDQLKSLNFNTTEAAARVRSFLETPGHFPKLEEYRTRLHSIINKILNGKVDKRFRLSFAELEVSLVLAFELHILRPTGMLNVITLYPKLCAKHMYKPNEEVLTKLEEYYKETIKEKGPELEEKVVDPEPIIEDEKAEEEGPFDIGKEMELNLAHLQDKEKEYCIICVQRVREIVLLPCCHFLTCTICSPKIYKCPVCNNRVEKNLQIFWS